MRRPKNPLILAAILASTLLLGARSAAAQYKQKNLVSNQHGMAIHTDRHLINGWGLAFFPHGPFWVADEGTGVSTVYGPHGRPIPLVVTIPPAPGQQVGSPTGMIANSTSNFVISKNGKSGPAWFIFNSGDGTISGWNPYVDPTHAVIVVDYSAAKPNRALPASYTGLTSGRNSRGQEIIYAADFNNGDIDMFDGRFHFLGSFTDPAPRLECSSTACKTSTANSSRRLPATRNSAAAQSTSLIPTATCFGAWPRTLRRVRSRRLGASLSPRPISGYLAMLF